MVKATLTFKCKKCGTKLTWGSDAVDETKISCNQCGQYFGTYADLRYTARQATVVKTKIAIRKGLKDIR